MNLQPYVARVRRDPLAAGAMGPDEQRRMENAWQQRWSRRFGSAIRDAPIDAATDVTAAVRGVITEVRMHCRSRACRRITGYARG